MPFVILFLLIVIGVILYSYSYKEKKPAPKKGNQDTGVEDDPFNVVYFNEIKDAQEVKEEIEEPEAPEVEPETED